MEVLKTKGDKLKMLIKIIRQVNAGLKMRRRGEKVRLIFQLSIEENDLTGRVIIMGSHPHFTNGEERIFMSTYKMMVRGTIYEITKDETYNSLFDSVAETALGDIAFVGIGNYMAKAVRESLDGTIMKNLTDDMDWIDIKLNDEEDELIWTKKEWQDLHMKMYGS